MSKYLTGLLHEHIVNIRSDAENKLDVLQSAKQTTKYMAGGGERYDQVVGQTEHIKQYVQTQGEDDPEQKRVIDGFEDTLRTFKRNVDGVLVKIEELESDTKQLDKGLEMSKVQKAKAKYEKFLDAMAAYNADNPLTRVKDLDLNSFYIRTEKDEDLDFTDFLKIFNPMITSYKLLAKTPGKDLLSVFTAMEKQSNLNISAFKAAEAVLISISARLDEFTRNDTLPEYVIENTPEGSYVIPYHMSDKDNESESYQIKLAEQDVYEYMTELEIAALSSDSLETIRADSLSLIRNYVSDLEQYRFPDDIVVVTDVDEIRQNLDIIRGVDKQGIAQSTGGSQMGGDRSDYQGHATAVSQHNIYSKMYEFVSELANINNRLSEVKSKIDRVMIDRERKEYYLMYVAQVGMMNDVGGINMYRYINRGILDYYRSIIADILDRIDKLGPDKRPSHTYMENTNVKLLDAEYFRTYHLRILLKMRNLIEPLVIGENKLTLSDVIDIRSCTGPIYEDFVLFNHFKDILDNYYEVMQNKVSIYARINDFGRVGEDIPEKGGRVFIKDGGNDRKVNADYSKCLYGHDGRPYAHTEEKKREMTDATPVLSKFNMVFDDDYPDNESISKYMSISANISKKKGVMIMTYGYSGTGKTYTLFGRKAKGGVPAKKGLLQSAIEGIKARSDIFFRAYEMYGAGLVYPFYWCDSVTETAYIYDIDYEAGIARSDIEIDDLAELIGSDVRADTYVQIPANKTSQFFSNFSQIVESIDDIRIEKGRIKATPNNPVSSRSIIVYDILIMVKDELVKLTVVDLPGREEIVTTYTDDYVSKYPQFNNSYDRAVLSSMAVNPLYLSILCPGLVFDAFNHLPDNVRESIMSQQLDMGAKDTCVTEEGQNDCIRQEIDSIMEKRRRVALERLEQENIYSRACIDKYGYRLVEDDDYEKNVDFFNEVVIKPSPVDVSVRDGGRAPKRPCPDLGRRSYKKVSDLIDILDFKFELGANTNIGGHNGEYQQQLKIKYQGWTSPAHVSLRESIIQYQAVIAIHLINRILLMNDIDTGATEKVDKFMILSHIYDFIAKRRKVKLKNFDALAIAPFEGVYINENIVGLMKVLISNPNLLAKSSEEVRSLIEPQEFKTFGEIKKEIRSANGRLYTSQMRGRIHGAVISQGETGEEGTQETQPSTVDDPKYSRFENIYINNDELEKIYQSNRDLYFSQHIFRYCHPRIEEVMEYYVNTGAIDTPRDDPDPSEDYVPHIRRLNEDEEPTKRDIPIGPIKDAKVFYLFSNKDQDLKCEHQYKLYANTLGLMRVVDPVNN
jgi:Kinesin motor domain